MNMQSRDELEKLKELKPQEFEKIRMYKDS